jgi:hypothetical protein
MDDADLTPAERAEIERVAGVLADPAVWLEPPADHQAVSYKQMTLPTKRIV